MGSHFYAPVIVPDHTGSAVVEFSPFADGTVGIRRWPVIAWWLCAHEHSGQNETWIHAQPITTRGNVYQPRDKNGYSAFSMTCLEMNWFADGRVWEFSNGTAFNTWQAAQEYVRKELADRRQWSEKATKHKAAQKKREAKARAARRAAREVARAPVNGGLPA